MASRLEVVGLTCLYSRQNTRGITEISFEALTGEVIALLGPNGSGKSTLLKRIAGVIDPQDLPRGSSWEGTIRYRGTDLLQLSSRERALKVAYLPADLFSEFPLRASEVVGLGALAQGREAAPQEITIAMEQAGCLHLIDRHFETLSGGERQLVLLARVLVQGAAVLLLDETVSKMDLNHQRTVGELLCQLVAKDYLVIFVSHDVNLAASWSTRTIFLNEGKILIDGPTKDVYSRETFEKLYPGTPLQVTLDAESGIPRVGFSERPTTRKK